MNTAAEEAVAARLAARGIATTAAAWSEAQRADLGTAAPTHVAEPADEATAREIVVEAGVADAALVPVGGATALGSGEPLARRGLALSTRRLARIVEHSPSDFVVAVEAGCTLAALQRELAPHRQWVAIEPPDGERATIGGLVATAATSFVAGAHGTLRHHLLGLRVLGADGRFAKAGGRVVKNVAGYDLMKLHHGAHGTLGLVVAATLRLRPLPAADLATWASTDDPEAIAALSEAIGQPGFLPAATWFTGHLRAGGLDGELLVRFQGARAAVADQAVRIEPLASGRLGAWRRELIERGDDGGTTATARPPPLLALERIAARGEAAGDLSLSLHFAPGRVREVVAALGRFGAGALALELARGTGWLKIATDGPETPLADSLAHGLATLHAELAAIGATLFVRAGPAAVRARLPAHALAGATARVAAALRAELDPAGRFNPGRLGR